MITKVRFGGTIEEQNELSQLVLIGEKVATSSLLELKKEKDLTSVGDIWQIQDGFKQDICMVKVSEVEIKKFKDITEDFAIKEGDGSFNNWLEIHKNYYSFLLNKNGKLLEDTTLLECVYFEKIVI